jgi:uncharacterized protein (TIGR01777 family)
MHSLNQRPAPCKFLLSGASGMLGTALRAELVLRQCPFVQLVRRTPAASELQWNPRSGSPFADSGMADPSALEGFDAAIHLSGANVAAHRWTVDYQREMAASRVDSTRALATALAGLERRPQVLLVASAIGIYGDRGDQLLDEDSGPGAGILPDLCQAWEAAAGAAVAAGIRVAHLRFGVVLHKGEGALGQMLPLFRLGLGGRLGSGRQWMSWIGLPDLLEAILFTAQTASLSGAINLVAPNPVTNAEFTRILAAALHRPALAPAPAFVLRLAFGRMADEALLASARVVPRKLLDAGFGFCEPTLEQALATALK